MMKKLFKNGDDLYLIIREFPIYKLTDSNGNIKNQLFNAWKEYLKADKVLKNQTHFMFCETVQELEWETVTS